MDELTQMNDLFITGNLTTCDENRKIHSHLLETDTHWRAPAGQGDFNWRWKWDVKLPVMDPTRLLIEAWDQDVVGSNDFIGNLQLDINALLLQPATTSCAALTGYLRKRVVLCCWATRALPARCHSHFTAWSVCALIDRTRCTANGIA